MRLKSSAVLALLLTSFAASASAETPYAPRKASIADLIRSANYERVPIQLTEFTFVSQRSVVNKQRLDFELSYDVGYWDLVEWFEKHHKERTPVSILDPEVFPNAKVPQLLVYGKHGTGDTMNFTLGNPELPYRFTLQVRPDDQARAVVVIHNAIYSAIYSGLMPARAPFRPAGSTQPIPFRWN